MGDIKRQRKKYSTPSHPWQKERIEEEKIILKEYGLKNKKEIWRISSLLGRFKDGAKKIIALKTKQAEKGKKQARQFIVHGHIIVGEKKVTAPSYLVLKKEEDLVNFAQNSALSIIDHPERL